MKKFLIYINTVWPNTLEVYRGVAKDSFSLNSIAQALAYDCFLYNGGIYKMLEESGLEYTLENIELCKDASPCIYFHIVFEFHGTEEEWKKMGGEIYYGS